MPGLMNAAAYSMRKWGSEKVKRVKRKNIKLVKGDVVISDCQKLASFNSYEPIGTEKSLNVTIQIQEKVEDDNDFQKGYTVLYKDDEDRFSQQCTLKLKTFSLYNISLEVTEDEDLVYIDIGGKQYNCFKLFDNRDNLTKVYMFTWSTDNIKPTQRKYRAILPVAMKFKGYEELNFQLSVKFYYSNDVLHFSGKTLTSIDVKAEVGVGEQHHTHFTSISFE